MQFLILHFIMNSNFKFLFSPRFYLSLVLIFSINLSFDYFYQFLNIGLLSEIKNGTFYSLKNFLFLLLFWFNIKKSFLSLKKSVFAFLFIFICTSIPYFFSTPIIYLDQENLIFKVLSYGVGYSILAVLDNEKSNKKIYFPLFFLIIPLINLDLANNFEVNWGIVSYFNKSTFVFKNISIELVISLIYTLFFAIQITIFAEIHKLIYHHKIEKTGGVASVKRVHFISLVLIFKTFSYWLISTLIIVCLGQNMLPLFTNKVSLILFGFGTVILLIICGLFTRRFVTIYFYDKIGNNNWLFAFLFFPIIGGTCLFLMLLIPSKKFKTLVFKGFSKEKIKYILLSILIFQVLNFYFATYIKIPESESDLRIGFFILKILFPFLAVLMLVLTTKSKYFFQTILLIYVSSIPLLIIYVVPLLEKSNDVLMISTSLHHSFQTFFLLFLLYPVFYFKEYLGFK